MRNTDYFKNKKITIVGLARSGLACADLLSNLGADVSVTDNQDNALTHSNALKLKSMVQLRSPLTLSGVEVSKNIKIELGRHTKEFIKGRDTIVVSPGVTDEALPIVWAEEFGIPIISEIEVAWILCPATIIAVTGTNGKTTVTTLIGKILETKQEKVFVLGNIGNPFCAQVDKIGEGDFVSLEVSSFQLERINNFKPKISVFLNFTCNHLDRYSNMSDYLKAKKRIFMNQDKSDYLVLNYQDPVVRELAKETQGCVVYFYETPKLNPNFSCVLAVGSILGIEKELCLDIFSKFRGLKHRLEQVLELDNIEFINDSKSTTVDSTIWALKNISKPVVLIAGGRDKGSEYNVILDLIQKKVKEIILIGEAKEKIEHALRGFLSINKTRTLEEAVNIAFGLALPGDCVLLSPMCSSFDMFSNYEERGEVFKKAVYDLARNKV